jgi:hypothetical protein
MQEKRVRLTVDFRVSFGEITPETVVRMYPARDLGEVRRDSLTLVDVARQGRLLAALLGDEEALRGFLACAVIDEVVSGGGELLRKALRAKGEEEVLWPVIERLDEEDTEFYEGARADGVFEEQIELLLFSTPVECLGVRMAEVNEADDEARESDNLR